jgi:hypothetical protein
MPTTKVIGATYNDYVLKAGHSIAEPEGKFNFINTGRNDLRIGLSVVEIIPDPVTQKVSDDSIVQKLIEIGLLKYEDIQKYLVYRAYNLEQKGEDHG